LTGLFTNEGDEVGAFVEREEIGPVLIPGRPDELFPAEFLQGFGNGLDFFIAERFAGKDAALPVREPDIEALSIGGKGPEIVDKALMFTLQKIIHFSPEESQHLVKMIEIIAGLKNLRSVRRHGWKG
jgi:hypothetical protein